MPIRIASIEAVPYALPFREPYVTARGSLTRREMVLLRLRDEDGREGLGEAVPLSLRGGATLKTVVRELEALMELALMAPAGFIADVRAAVLTPPSRCAVETALWDLELQDGAQDGERAEVVCNATLVADEPAEVASGAEAWAADGFRSFKLKVGSGDDVGQVEAVRGALGPDARLRVDANEAWDVEEAARVLADLEPLGVELAEQPVGGLEAMAELAERTSIPLAADESVASVDEARRAAKLRACAATGVKLSKVGGPAVARAIAGALPAYMTSALDGPVGIAAACRVAATLGRDAASVDGEPLAHGLATQRLFALSVATVECELRGDVLVAPLGPGLGVVIDEDALEAHRL